MVSELDTERCVSEDAELRRGVDCEIPHRLRRRMKRGVRTIFASGGFGLLQMISKLNTKWCASKDAEL